MTAAPTTRVDGRYRLERQIGAGRDARASGWRSTRCSSAASRSRCSTAPIGGDSDHIERFRREARAVAQLQHPHIVGVLDTGEHDGVPFIVLEYVDGETLKERIQRVGRLTITEAVAYRDRGRARARRRRTRAGSSTATSSRRTSCSTPRAAPRSPTSGSRAAATRTRSRVGGRVLGHDRLRLARAGARPRGDRPVRPLLARGRALRVADRLGAVQRRRATLAVATMHVRNELPDVQQRRPEVSAALAAVVERATAKPLGAPLRDAPPS